MTEASAPGKLLLTGEYAVLDGAPAVTLAIGGPARVRAQSSANWVLARPGSGDDWSFHLEPPARVAWQGAPPDAAIALPEAVLVECLQHWPRELGAQPQRLELDTTRFAHEVDGQRTKLGLGSSAALVVAMAGAVQAACAIPASGDEFRAWCLAAHRRFQRGLGSGVDVVTAIHGGSLVCTPQGDDVRAEPLPFPADLHVVVVWTGQAASTPALIGRYEDFAARKPALFAEQQERLRAAAASAASAWRTGATPSVLAGVSNYADALRSMDRAGNIGIWTAEHRALAKLAADRGAIYKTSGAGGGDLGLALTGSAAVAAELRCAVQAAGGLIVDVEPGQPGLQVAAD